MRKTDEPIIVEQIFNTTIKKVWNAITNLEQACIVSFVQILCVQMLKDRLTTKFTK